MKASRSGRIKAHYMTKLIKGWLKSNKVTKHPNLDVNPTDIASGITAKCSAKGAAQNEV